MWLANALKTHSLNTLSKAQKRCLNVLRQRFDFGGYNRIQNFNAPRHSRLFF